MAEAYIVAAARTAGGRTGGRLAGWHPVDLAASVPFPKRLGQPDEYAALVELMLTNRYFNAERVRLDGGIRMAPR